jgi:hypothetical protein
MNTAAAAATEMHHVRHLGCTRHEADIRILFKESSRCRGTRVLPPGMDKPYPLPNMQNAPCHPYQDTLRSCTRSGRGRMRVIHCKQDTCIFPDASECVYAAYAQENGNTGSYTNAGSLHELHRRDAPHEIQTRSTLSLVGRRAYLPHYPYREHTALPDSNGHLCGDDTSMSMRLHAFHMHACAS